MAGWRALHRSESGIAAIETLLVLPYHILLMCLILQLGHFMVAFQVVQFAAFAAARAAVTADLDPAALQKDENWPAGGGGGATEERQRAVTAALNACRFLEFFGGQGDYLRVRLVGLEPPRPWGSPPPDQVILTMQVAYLVDLPIPFANRLFFNAMSALGSGRASNDLRVVVLQKCSMVRPWN
jgi:hypothetical protein